MSNTNDSVVVDSKIYRKKVQADKPIQTKKCNHTSKKHKKPKFSIIYEKFIITFD